MRQPSQVCANSSRRRSCKAHNQATLALGATVCDGRSSFMDDVSNNFLYRAPARHVGAHDFAFLKQSLEDHLAKSIKL